MKTPDPTSTPPTRQEIQQRRQAIAASAAHYRREFNRGSTTITTCLEYLQAECQHPPEAIISNYEISHFDRTCSDCGARIKK